MRRNSVVLTLLCFAVIICGASLAGCTVSVMEEDYGTVGETPYGEYYEYYGEYNGDPPVVQGYHTRDLLDSKFFISEYFIDLWENSEEVTVGPAHEYMGMENYGLYAEFIEDGTDLDIEIGRIIRETTFVDDEAADDYYLLLYEDYDQAELDDENTELTLYLLTSEYLEKSLTEFYDDLYEDDVSGSPYPLDGVQVIGIGALFVFVLLPLAGIVAVVIFMVRKRPGAPYRAALCILCASLAAIIIASVVTVLLML